MKSRQIFEHNALCRLLGIRVPVIQAGMVWCSGWELAAAVARAGGLGLIGAGSMDAETLRIHIRKAQQAAGDGKFGVNVPLLYRHAPDLLRVIQEEGVRVVFTSAGNPATWTAQLKAAGITVAHVVSSVKFARKAEAAGVDLVVAEGFEAGGHNGREELTTFVLIPQVRAAITIPLVAAGGIADGAGMLAAMALGADGVQVGSRFVASLESSAHPHFKQAVITAPEDGTQLTLKEITPVRLLRNRFLEQVQAAYARGASREELSELLGRGRARKGMFEGDLDEGELEIGQVAAALRDIPAAADILHRMLDQYARLRGDICSTTSRFF